MEWFYLPLSDVVKGPGVYDWTPVEKELRQIAADRHQGVFRFYVDYPKMKSGIPQYLLDGGMKTFTYTDEGNQHGNAQSVSPAYSDPRMIECMVQFIHAGGEV
jgi:hypothetical protein